MVSSYNSSSSQFSDDAMMTSENDDIYEPTSSSLGTPMMVCPHCDFTCASPTAMTQHSWDTHPLLMRRKKHLITSRRSDDVKSEIESGELNTAFAITNGVIAADSPRIHTKAKKIASTTSHEPQKLGQLTTAGQLRVATPEMESQDSKTKKWSNSMTSPIPSTNAASISAPQRHIAIVKPVPSDHRVTTGHTSIGMDPMYLSRFQSMQHNLQQHSMKLLAHPSPRDQLVYAPMYNVFVSALNQYVTIPIPISGSMVPAHSTSTQSNDAVETSHPHQTTQNNPVSNVSATSKSSSSNIQHNQISNGTLSRAEVSANLQRPMTRNIGAVKPFQQRNNARDSAMPNGRYAGSIKALLQSHPITQNGHDPPFHPTKNERGCDDKEPFPKAKSSSIPGPQFPKVNQPVLGEERIRALENALRATDLCDIHDKSSSMPFQCPDGVWRMVTFKCIRGVWLVNIPGVSRPTVYVPCDTVKTKSPPAVDRPKSMLGEKRKFPDQLTVVHDVINTKRMCASAPILPAQKTEKPKQTTLKRSRSNPSVTNSLPRATQHFTNVDGKKINISMIKSYPSQSTGSCSLIRSLLLRKPNTDVSVTSLKLEHAKKSTFAPLKKTCNYPLFATDRHITEGFRGRTVNPADSMAY